MELVLKREVFTNKSTIGRLFVDGVYDSFVLEDTVRPDGIKVHGATAIPKGRYEVTITFSKRFQRALPLLLNVPGFEGIRIHPGNTAADTEGCLLIGKRKGTDAIYESREAFSLLFLQLQRAIHDGKIFITIEGDRPA